MADVAQGVESLGQFVATHYGLPDVGVPEFMPGAHQRRHRKFLVTTGAGRFLIKSYDRDPAVIDALHFQHRLSEHLAEHGLPVARIQPTLDGKRLVEVDKWVVELQEFVDGELMTVTPKRLARASLALGKFHAVCRDFPCPERDTRMWRFSEVPREMFAGLYERAQQEPGDDTALDAQCNRLALFLREAGNELDWDSRSRFETGLIHGDWHSGNLLFRGDELVAILDLEFAGDGCYLEDLSYAMSGLCIRTSTESKRMADRCDMLLHYYQKNRRLSPIEERALYYAVGLKQIGTVCYQSVKKDGKVAGLAAREWMERLDAQTAWLSERAQRIQFGG
jgi:Ser/Thr protein kinase RdoA (MazF antagonist)